jgi:hypothetical protein
MLRMKEVDGTSSELCPIADFSISGTELTASAAIVLGFMLNWIKNVFLRFEVLMVMEMLIVVFWVVTPCGL